MEGELARWRASWLVCCFCQGRYAVIASVFALSRIVCYSRLLFTVVLFSNVGEWGYKQEIGFLLFSKQRAGSF